MYEKSHEPPVSQRDFVHRVLGRFGMVLPLIAGSLLMGVLGYHVTENMDWIDALLNASMIMSGMGPATELHTWEGKLFASVYALYSGLFLIAVTGFLLVPFLHRILHKFHHKKEGGQP